MHAIIVTGGKQYRVTAGSIIEVEKLDVAVGDSIKIDQILALSGDKNVVGSPTVAGAVVEAQVLEQGKADKVLIFKKKRRHNYRRKNGHRQRFTALHITSISLNGTALVTAEKRTPKPRATTPAGAAAAPAKKVASAPKAKAAVKPAAKKAAPAKKAAAKPAAKKAAK
ncbi:MAG: 50S ribosomal protein L21 [Alphaproteobacteria bacterium]|nr:50S ribosomal protein L21 [Alphaproteobacteria bacterium]